MSVNYRAGIVHGWKVTKEEYNNFPDSLVDEYGFQMNCYTSSGEYLIGIKHYGIEPGFACSINPDTIEMSPEDYEKISTMIPDIVKKHPNPSIYLYCSVT